MIPSPRPRRSPAAALLAVLVLVVVLAGVAGPALVGVAPAGAQTEPVEAQPARGAQRAEERGRVLVITAPRLTWAEIEEVRPPNITSLLRRSAVAVCSIRTAGSNTRPGDAYLTIGAGNRMGTTPEADGEVVERDEPVVAGDPTNVYQRTTGITATGSILVLGKPVLDRQNRDLHFGAVGGALASALRADDRSMAVLANADREFGVPRYRQAALAAMDRRGQVQAGMVSTELLRVDDPAAFGVSVDPAVHGSVFATLWDEHDVVVAELSDLERAEAARAAATTEQGEKLYRRALAASDELVGEMLRRVDLRRDRVIFLAPTSPTDATQTTVFGVAGPGFEPGYVTSSTTRRSGYVTLTDIAPSILTWFDAEVPDAMNDTRLTQGPDDEGTRDGFSERMEWLIDRTERAVVRDNAFGPTTVVFIVVVVIDIALAMLCLARLPRLRGVVRALALVALATPPVTFLLGLVPLDSPAALGAAVAGGAIALAILASVLRRLDTRLAPLSLVGLLWLVLAVDILAGGALQIDTIFGYSPIVAGRFAGFGNQAFSMIALSSLLLSSAFMDRWAPSGPVGRDAPEAARRRQTAATVGVLVWFAATVVLDGHPALGSDVGGVLAFVPAATVALLMYRGVKVNVRLAALIAAGTVAVLAVFAAVDMSRPAAEQTHLGRSVTKLFDGEAGQILERKIAANLRVLTSSVWAWIIPVALVYFVYLTWRPNRTLQRLGERHTHFRAFLVSALTLGVLAMALNDSGVSLPGIMVALTAAYVSYLVVEMERGPTFDGDPVFDRPHDQSRDQPRDEPHLEPHDEPDDG